MNDLTIIILLIPWVLFGWAWACQYSDDMDMANPDNYRRYKAAKQAKLQYRLERKIQHKLTRKHGLARVINIIGWPLAVIISIFCIDICIEAIKSIIR
jgi:hypothetical protein